MLLFLLLLFFTLCVSLCAVLFSFFFSLNCLYQFGDCCMCKAFASPFIYVPITIAAWNFNKLYKNRWIATMSIVNVGVVTHFVKILTVFTCFIQLDITNCRAESLSSKRTDMYSDTVVSNNRIFYYYLNGQRYAICEWRIYCTHKYMYHRQI